MVYCQLCLYYSVFFVEYVEKLSKPIGFWEFLCYNNMVYHRSIVFSSITEFSVKGLRIYVRFQKGTKKEF